MDNIMLTDSLKSAKRRENLESTLRAKIRAEQYSYDSPIPTEMELSLEFSISRNTVRKVLQILSDEGLLSKRHGLGTFVVPPAERTRSRVVNARFLLIFPGYGPEFRLESSEEYAKKLAAGVSEYITLNGCRAEFLGEPENAPAMLEQYRKLRYDGIIWDRPVPGYYDTILRLAAAHVPQVTISREIEGVPSFFFDFDRGLDDILEFLNGIGHTKIGFLDQKVSGAIPVFEERRRYFAQCMEHLTGEADGFSYVALETPLKTVTREMDLLYERHPDLTALFVSAALLPHLEKYAKFRNISIPRDLSVIVLGESSVDRTEDRFSRLFEPRRRIGYLAAELLAEMHSGKETVPEKRLLEGELLIRKSCISPLNKIRKAV